MARLSEAVAIREDLANVDLRVLAADADSNAGGLEIEVTFDGDDRRVLTLDEETARAFRLGVEKGIERTKKPEPKK